MRYLILIALAALMSLAVACGDDDDATTTPTAAPATSVTATSVTTATSTPATTATPAATVNNVCQANPDPAPASELVIDLPQPGDQVTSPVTVAGKVLAFEATFRVAIKDASGNDITDVQGMSAEGQVLSDFEVVPTFTVGAATPACIWVYQRSAMDNSIINVGQVPVTLAP